MPCDPSWQHDVPKLTRLDMPQGAKVERYLSIKGYLTKIQKHTQNKYLHSKNSTETFCERAVKLFFACSAKIDFVHFVCPTISGTLDASKINFCTTSEK